MKAYDVKYGTKVRIISDAATPVEAPQVGKGDIITILRLDGMYCNAEDKDGNRIYIAAWTEVEEIK